MRNEALTLRRRSTQHLLLILALSTVRASATEHWEVLPPTPAPIHSEHSGHANANGISIYWGPLTKRKKSYAKVSRAVAEA